MKLLITGAFKASDELCEKLSESGYDLLFLQEEKADLRGCGIEPSSIDGVICNGLFLYSDIKEFSSLKFIQLTSAGLDRVPLDYIKEHNIKLFNARGVYSVPMAEYAVCGVLQLYKKSREFFERQKERKWEKSRNLLELCGKTVCIAGCGSVGTECAKRFRAFGCTVVGLDIRVFENREFDKIYPIESANEVLPVSDVLVLTLPLTEQTEHFIDAERLAVMKSGAIVVNISRGKVVKESDLANALKTRLGGAVLDVFEEEPLSESSPLWTEENVIVTPHNSFIGDGNEKRLKEVILENLSNMG